MSTKKNEQTALRKQGLENLIKHLKEDGEDVVQTKSNHIAYPVVMNGNEYWIEIAVSVPTGSRDGEAYDGYIEAEDYEMKCKIKEKKEEKRKEEKAKKAERDRKSREIKKLEREKRKAEAGE